MSTQHKAFVFDHDGFSRDLASILYRALESGDLEPMVQFIEQNRMRLRDPHALTPLDEHWRDKVDLREVQQLGDVALTAYYDPREEIGLLEGWEEVLDDVGREVDGDAVRLLFGEPFGPPQRRFNPGKLGSFFRPWDTVHQHRERLARVMAGDHWSDTIADLDGVLREADEARRGLYVTL
jgi:hypothetical protein